MAWALFGEFSLFPLRDFEWKKLNGGRQVKLLHHDPLRFFLVALCKTFHRGDDDEAFLFFVFCAMLYFSYLPCPTFLGTA